MAEAIAPATEPATVPAVPITKTPTGSEAAAILLMLLGDDEAADVLSRLDPGEVQHLGAAMFSVADVSEVQVENVFDQFVGRAKQRTTIGFGAAPRIRNVMERALGPERARRFSPGSPRRPTAARWMRCAGWTRRRSRR
jgi:flagellar motor switch protein FliG